MHTNGYLQDNKLLLIYCNYRKGNRILLRLNTTRKKINFFVRRQTILLEWQKLLIDEELCYRGKVRSPRFATLGDVRKAYPAELDQRLNILKIDRLCYLKDQSPTRYCSDGALSCTRRTRDRAS